MDKRYQSESLPVEYEDVLADERLLWKELHEPQFDVTENVKAYARWSAAAERAKALSVRLHIEPADTPH